MLFSMGRRHLKNVKMVLISEVPKHANIVRSHVLYKVKINDDGSFIMKFKIAPHDNEDSEMDLLRTECAVCPPTGIGVLSLIAAIFKCTLIKPNSKRLFCKQVRRKETFKWYHCMRAMEKCIIC